MIAAIVLAAGSSSRMGEPKQSLDIHGEPLLTRTVRAVLDSGIEHTAVVLGAYDDARQHIPKDIRVDTVLNKVWEKGMGSSIKTGLEHLCKKYPSLDTVLIFVCDQPLLSAEIISNILQKHQHTGKHIVASGYAHVPGVPVLFSKSFFDHLRNLPDDQGAKKIIIQHRAEVEIVPFPGGEVDLDTIGDYRAFIARKRDE